MSRTWLLVPLLLAAGAVLADDAPKDKDKKPVPDAKEAKSGDASSDKDKKPAPDATEAKSQAGESGNLGMSILGNQEAPKALVIVPWKRSEMGEAHGISTMLDDSRLPIDKEVFMRMLSYYEIRSETSRHDGAPSTGRETAPAGAAQPVTAPHRRKP